MAHTHIIGRKLAASFRTQLISILPGSVHKWLNERLIKSILITQ